MMTNLKNNAFGVALSGALKARCIEGCANGGFDRNRPLVNSGSLKKVVDA